MKTLDTQSRVNLDAELWTTAEIAEFLRLSVKHVQDRVTHDPTFPKARRVMGSRRWVAQEIREWVGVS